jgi:amidase
VFPHIEDHNFYVDQWSPTLLWNKVREFGALLTDDAFVAGPDDVFLLRHDEVRSALEELRLYRSSGGSGVPRGPAYWPRIVERRKRIYEALRRWTAPPALGQAPEAVTEPVTIMHWGITTGRVEEWLQRSSGDATPTIEGIAGSPGVVEGPARVIFDVKQLADVQAGEILVAPFTSTSWMPVFGRIAAAITDAGGVMCYAAIVAREYGLPAVLGTGSATNRIETGDRIQVDGDNAIGPSSTGADSVSTRRLRRRRVDVRRSTTARDARSIPSPVAVGVALSVRIWKAACVATRVVPEDLFFAGAAAQLDAMATGEVTSRQLTEASLKRVDELDGELNAFRVVLAEEALAAADEADRRRAGGEQAPLLGVPVAIKDDTEQLGQITMFGTSAPEEPARIESEVLRRLRLAGAVVVGRTNACELLMWPFTESKTWGATRNPWNVSRTAGGSSGGSAAAVAAGMVSLALGSDGGGSVRIPAACCGIFGLKTTRGLIPTAPHTDADHVFQGLAVYGPLARTVLDAALFLDATADRQDGPSFAEAARNRPERLRIAVATTTPLPQPVRREAVVAVDEMCETLRSLGHTVVEVSPRYRPALANFVIRYFAGIARSADALPHHERFEARTRRMAAIGRAVPGWLLARARRNEPRVRAGLDEMFESADLVLTPALAAPPVPIGRWDGKGALTTFNGVARWTPYTALWNVTGHPAASIPAGRIDAGLPVGVQVVGPLGGERTLLALASEIEAARPWASHRPPVS